MAMMKEPSIDQLGHQKGKRDDEYIHSTPPTVPFQSSWTATFNARLMMIQGYSALRKPKVKPGFAFTIASVAKTKEGSGGKGASSMSNGKRNGRAPRALAIVFNEHGQAIPLNPKLSSESASSTFKDRTDWPCLRLRPPEQSDQDRGTAERHSRKAQVLICDGPPR